ncbi:MAG: hypothetical protein R3C59_09985 [Planctomycetaceae bacterium]
MLISLQLPVGNSRGPVYTESLLRTLHRANAKRDTVTLLMESAAGSLSLGLDCPDSLRMLFLQELQDAYPGVVVRGLRKGELPTGSLQWQTDLRKQPDVLPLRSVNAFLDETELRQFADPVAGLLASVRTGRSGRTACRIELCIRPASIRRTRSAERTLEVLQRGFRRRFLLDWYLTLATHPRFLFRTIGWLLSSMARPQSRHRRSGPALPVEAMFECRLQLTARAPASAAHIAKNKLQQMEAAFGRFHTDETRFVVGKRHRLSKPHRRRGFLLSAAEIAMIWHPLTESGDSVSRVERPSFRELEPPVAFSSEKGKGDKTILGRTCFRGQRNRFGIATDDLRRHLLAIGKTGCGKSTFLLNVVRQQMEAGRGVVQIDPHGQLAEEVLNVVPKRRTNDVIFFDAADRIAPVGFNPLTGPPGTDPTLIADGVLTSFKNVFGFEDGSAPRLLHILRNCLLTLIGTPFATLTGVQRILVDSGFRKSCVARVRNPAVREFWLTEFNRWNDRDRTQYIASLQNKLGAFTTNERLQRILDPGQKGIQLRTIMDRSQILVCNLSKGTVGHDASTLLGSLLLSSLQVAAMSRADVPEFDRPDCVVVIDEFHSYLSDGNSTMADALAESRKYRTSYVLSTQMLEQLDPATLAGVLGNCGSTLCMTVGPRDAEVLAGLLGSGLTPADLMAIPKYHAYLRLLIAGAPHTFSMTTLPPSRSVPNRASIIRRASQQRYGSHWNRANQVA